MAYVRGARTPRRPPWSRRRPRRAARAGWPRFKQPDPHRGRRRAARRRSPARSSKGELRGSSAGARWGCWSERRVTARVIMYGRPGCHLCEERRARSIARVCADLGEDVGRDLDRRRPGAARGVRRGDPGDPRRRPPARLLAGRRGAAARRAAADPPPVAGRCDFPSANVRDGADHPVTSRSAPPRSVRLVSAGRRVGLFSRSQTLSSDDGAVRGPSLAGWKRETVTAKASSESARDIPEATVARLPVYLRALITLERAGTAHLLQRGARGRGRASTAPSCARTSPTSAATAPAASGYDVDYLRYQIAREIGVTQDWPVVIVGIGNLGHALANYSGFRSRGFRVVALLDADPERHERGRRRGRRAALRRPRADRRPSTASPSA